MVSESMAEKDSEKEGQRERKREIERQREREGDKGDFDSRSGRMNYVSAKKVCISGRYLTQGKNQHFCPRVFPLSWPDCRNMSITILFILYKIGFKSLPCHHYLSNDMIWR